MQFPRDRTVYILLWLLSLGALNFLSREKIKSTSFHKIEKINLNKASIEDLMRIQKLHFKTAQRILEERNKRGGFKSFKELDTVSGVGPKTLERLKDRLCIDC